MEIRTTAEEYGRFLLERMRETPMRRGGLPSRTRQLMLDIAHVIAGERVPPQLAKRVALQLVLKFHRRDLHDEPEWQSIGRILQREAVQLRDGVGMSPQRIVTALPKVSAAQLVDFLDELNQTERRVARTILHAAVNASEPLATGRRYLAEYRLVVRKLRAIDPTMARTVAAATFSAGAPLSKAMEHLQRFSSLLKQHEDEPQMARRLARAAFRARTVVKEVSR